MPFTVKFSVNQTQIQQGEGFGFVNIIRPGPGVPLINDGNIPPTISDPAYGTWAASTPEGVGAAIIDSNGNIEIAIVATGNTGAAQPAWPTVIGGTVVDTGVTWQMRGRAVSPTWKTATAYLIDDQLRDSNSNVQLCIVPGTSGAAQPAWSAIQYGITNDNGVQWFNLGPSLSLGASEGELTCDMEGKVEAIGADQETAPIASVMTAETAQIGGQFKQLDLQLVTTAIPHATFASGASSALPSAAQNFNEIGVGGLVAIPTPAIAILSPRRLYTQPGAAKFYTFILQKGYATGKPGLGFTRTKTSMWKAQWDGLAVESWPNGYRVARLLEQT